MALEVIGDFAVVWLLSPTRSFSPTAKNSMARYINGLPGHALQVYACSPPPGTPPAPHTPHTLLTFTPGVPTRQPCCQEQHMDGPAQSCLTFKCFRAPPSTPSSWHSMGMADPHTCPLTRPLQPVVVKNSMSMACLATPYLHV